MGVARQGTNFQGTNFQGTRTMRWGMILGLALTMAVPVAAQEQTPEQKLAALGITLPAVDAPVANYVKAVRSGPLLFTAGHGPCGTLTKDQIGKVGGTLSVEQGAAAARATGVCLLATLKAELGTLSRVRRIVKVLGMVNSAPGFTEHPRVMNGFSDLMVGVFGDRGKHARSSVGVAALPGDMAVEIEMIVEVD
jgi:enamine deaminase RidA (YjgF/YER057c/UK114 family)